MDTGIIFLNVEKALDRVWHHGLACKMYQMGLQHRTDGGQKERTLTNKPTLEAGLLQGSVGAPQLYTIYSADMPNRFKREREREREYDRTKTALYSVGTIMSQLQLPQLVIRKLQAQLERVEQWCQRWRVAINADKSQTKYIEGKELQMSGKNIPWKKMVKYLRVVIDNNLSFIEHIEQIRDKVRGVMSRVYPLLGHNSGMVLTDTN